MTEKFFMVLPYDIVPVAYGHPESYRRAGVPQGSYVDVR